MHSFHILLAGLTLASAAKEACLPLGTDPLASLNVLKNHIREEDVQADSQTLQDITDKNGGHRVFGSKGSDLTIDWLYDELTKLNYYNVTKQPFVANYITGNTTLVVNGRAYDNALVYPSHNRSIAGRLVPIPDSICSGKPPAQVKNNIALINNGACGIDIKHDVAMAMGAAGVLVYAKDMGIQNPWGRVSPGSSQVLAPLDTSDEDVPTLLIAADDGQAFEKLAELGTVTVEIKVATLSEKRTTYNVIAETKGGNHNAVSALVAHSDAVPKGLGISNDGSAMVALLTIAKALPKANFCVDDAFRILFFSAEEYGLQGSSNYIARLTDSEIAKIRAILDFDMIASSSSIIGMYDGDGEGLAYPGPPRTAAVGDFSTFARERKNADQAHRFGGQAGELVDANNLRGGETNDDNDYGVFSLNAKAISDAVARYGVSLADVPRGGALIGEER